MVSSAPGDLDLDNLTLNLLSSRNRDAQDGWSIPPEPVIVVIKEHATPIAPEPRIRSGYCSTGSMLGSNDRGAQDEARTSIAPRGHR